MVAAAYFVDKTRLKIWIPQKIPHQNDPSENF